MQVRQQVADTARGGAGRRLATAAGVAGVLVLGLAGCGQMAAALDKQWMTVDFAPGTSIATALHVRTACSHIQDTPALPMPQQRTVLNTMYGVRYDTTNSSPAELSQLQTCLQNFKSVAGFDPEDTGDEGS